MEWEMVPPMKGLESYSFDDCLSLASIAEIYALKIPFLHINQLIANKKAVNRPKDQIDVMELEKIKKTEQNPVTGREPENLQFLPHHNPYL